LSVNPPAPALHDISLSRREIEPADCGHAAAFLERTNYGHHNLDMLCDVWPHLLRRGVLKAVLVEDARRRLVSLGASVFVRAAAVAELQSSAAPFVTARVMTTALDRYSAVCTPTDVARSNACEGLHVFIIHSGVAEVEDEDCLLMPTIKAHLMKGFMDLHAGYNVRRILVEAYGDEERSMYVEGSGFCMLNAYGQSHESKLRGNKRPCLVSLDRADVLAKVMHPLLPMFSHHAAPLCAFGGNERALLAKALIGHTDRELAHELGVSIYTVKKRWVAILERVERCIPFTLVGTTERGERGTRGSQKRHLLLRYLRNHPEELTPYSKADGVKR
jgi:hypothetical protein